MISLQAVSKFPSLLGSGWGRVAVFDVALSLLIVASWTAESVAQDDPTVQVPAGFEATLYADDDLAHDIFSMTTDAQGRIVVSGLGYVRILIDGDGDGKAETFRQFADGPKTGAQGMCFHGRSLLCSGDGGLIRYQDADGDDRADGPPDLFLKINAGGEHHAHAIEQGPDGWWYLIAGNEAGVTKSYASLPTSPVREPQAGTLLRLKPDLSAGEVFAHGFRNAYDFAFHPHGDMFTYDSDDERDVSLPWYRPTRVFHVLPGSHAGWISRSWKRPDDFLGMPPVVAAFGRGSPTGVVCYRHRQFPREYRDALFVLDWTFGRVMALPLSRDGDHWSSRPVTFMTGVGQHGFAPTDAVVGRDGALYVSVGGRGTRGGVFRVVYTGPVEADRPSVNEPVLDGKVATCLDAPEPLSSWSRAMWMPQASEIGRGPFVVAALDTKLSDARRVRAIEIVTELFGGLTGDELASFAKSPTAAVRARAAWSHGRAEPAIFRPAALVPFLNDADPFVVRSALEALVPADARADLSAVLPPLARQLGSPHRFVRQTAARVVTTLPPDAVRRLEPLVTGNGPQALLSFHFGIVDRAFVIHPAAVNLGVVLLEGDYPLALKLEAVRLLQLALGDVGPNEKRPAVFDGYASRLDLSEQERTLDPVRIRLARIYPTGEHGLDAELSRVLAMLTPYSASLLGRVLARIGDESHPVDDIHHLIVAARIPIGRTAEQRRGIAHALVRLEGKIKSLALNQESNWDDRVVEMYRALVALDPELPAAVIAQREFGRPGHVIFFESLPPELVERAVDSFAAAIGNDAEYPWTNDVAFVLGRSSNPAHRELLCGQLDNYAVRGAVLIVLAKTPQQTDRPKFVEGLQSSQPEVLAGCVEALSKLPLSQDAAEQLALLRTLRRLGLDDREYAIRDEVVRMLERSTGRDFGFVHGDAGRNPQSEAVAKCTAWLEHRYPEETAKERAQSAPDIDHLLDVLSAVNWSAGNAGRGGELFAKRACAQCHGSRQALGPDLAGVAKRFSRDDLFTAIAVPNRDVSPRYQTTLVQTVQGKVYTGLIVYESVDGVLLRNATGQTFRIEARDIETTRTLPESLMPVGLLKDLTPKDLSDLYAYLSQLGTETARAGDPTASQ